MVCRECGAYNAENLTHCRVCAAKLRDDDSPAMSSDAQNDQEAGRPARDFAQAPSWPKHAFSGASASKPLLVNEPSRADGGAPVQDGGLRSSIPPRTAAPAASAAAKPAFCPHCGKPALADAPFCPYCGEHLSAAAAPAARPAVSAQPAPRKAPVRPAPVPDDEYEDEDEDKPAPKKSAKAIAKPAKPAKAAKKYDDDFDDDEYDDEFDDEDEEDFAPKKGSKALLKSNKTANAPAKRGRFDDDFDDEDEFEEDDEYDDEYDDDFDDEPKKKGKGTTLLFWGLIVLLIALIVVFGLFIVNKKFNGSFPNMIASITSAFSKDKSGDVDAVPSADPGVMTDKLNTAEILNEYTDPQTGDVYYDIAVYALTGSSVNIITDTALKNSDPPTVPSNNQVVLRVARDVFMPNAPCDSEVVTIVPTIEITSPTGEVSRVEVNGITVTVPKLTLTLEQPAGGTVQQTFNNDPFEISGTVDDHTVEVYINGEKVTVYEGGVFTTTYTPKTPVSTDATQTVEPETVTVEARKNNFVTASQTITIEPYVVQNITLLVGNDAASLSAADGKITLQGTTTPGATITPTCANTSVTFGVPTVSETGTFTIAVSVGKMGAFEVKLDGVLDGYNPASATATVERPPSDSASAFLKACTKITESVHGKITAGTVTDGDVQCIIKVTEILGTTPYTIFKGTISGTELEVICCNRSAKSTINSGDVGEKKQVAASLVGLYNDTSLPFLWTWFIWNK